MTPEQTQSNANLTDGMRLMVQALKRNHIDTIYGSVFR